MADARMAAADFRNVASRVRNLPQNIRTELRKNLKSAGDETVAAIKGSALDIRTVGFGKPGAKRHVKRRPSMPGSLGERVGSTVSVATRMSSSSVTVRIVSDGTKMPGTSASKLPNYLNYKTPWRHPVFGHRDTWVAQQATRGGWFTKTAEDEKNRFHDAAVDAIRTALAKAEHS